jgi:hypothetical protein
MLTVGSSQFAVCSSAVRLAVMDLTGRILIEETRISDIPFKLNVSSLKAGMYIFRWTAGDGHSGSSKFIKAD